MGDPQQKNRFSRLKRVLGILGLLLLVLTLFQVIVRVLSSAAPSSAVQADLARMARLQATPSEAFTYLLGMGAPHGVDPVVEGRRLLPQYVASSQYRGDDSHAPLTPDAGHIRLNAPLNCDLSNEAGCIAQYFAAEDMRRAMLAQYPDAVSRYEQFQTYTDFHQPYPTTVTSFLPPYTLLVGGQKLWLLQQIDALSHLYPEHQQLEARKFQQAVLSDLGYWRSALGRADSLIAKMIFIRMIHQDVVVLAAIHNQYQLPVPQQQLLTADERSMTLVSANETALMTQAYIAYNNPYHCTWQSPMLCVRHADAVLAFDWNDTVNILQMQASQQLQLAELPPEQAYRHKDDVFHIGATHWVSNIGGSLLVSTAPIAYRDYAFRLHDLNLGLTLLNATTDQPLGKSDPVWLQSIHSPYGVAAGHAYLNGGGWLCLNTALQTKQNSLRGCIPWAKASALAPPPAAS